MDEFVFVLRKSSTYEEKCELVRLVGLASVSDSTRYIIGHFDHVQRNDAVPL